MLHLLMYILSFALFLFHSFAVNMGCGQYDGTDIALHFNPRFEGRDTVVFNTFQSGSWGGEERKNEGIPFRRGNPFEMAILVQPGSYQVRKSV